MSPEAQTPPPPECDTPDCHNRPMLSGYCLPCQTEQARQLQPDETPTHWVSQYEAIPVEAGQVSLI